MNFLELTNKIQPTTFSMIKFKKICPAIKFTCKVLHINTFTLSGYYQSMLTEGIKRICV